MSAPRLTGLDHVQLAMPVGEEALCRRFYGDLLGMVELDKPPLLAKRGGAWFRAGSIELHLGVEEEFRPARKAHPGIAVAGIDALAERLAAAGHPVRWADPAEIPGRKRFFTDDPFGNRLEFLDDD